MLLLEYTWPGNVRELRNIAERLVVLNNRGIIRTEDLYGVLPCEITASGNESASLPPPSLCRSSRKKDVLLQALEAANCHYGKAAALLGISRTTLWRRIKQLGIKVEGSSPM
jgi:transcriptional regulator of acetoin/glycerol metabolism